MLTVSGSRSADTCGIFGWYGFLNMNRSMACGSGEEPWLSAYMPNIMYCDSNAAAADGGNEQLGVIKGLAFVALRQIQDEEVFLNYRLNPQVQKPAWYAPVDVEEDKRRWY